MSNSQYMSMNPGTLDMKSHIMSTVSVSKGRTLSSVKIHNTIPHDLQVDLFQQIKGEIQLAVDGALKKHKLLMGHLLENYFFKESEIHHYHNLSRDLIVKAFNSSLSTILNSVHPNVQLEYEKKLADLKNLIDSQLVSYVRKHELVTDEITKKIKDFTNTADCLYEDLMENCLKGVRENGGKLNLTKIHNDCHHKAINEFHRLVLQTKFPQPEIWQKELDSRILDKFQDYQLEFPVKDEETTVQNAKIEKDPNSEPKIPILQPENQNLKRKPPIRQFPLHKTMPNFKFDSVDEAPVTKSDPIPPIRTRPVSSYVPETSHGNGTTKLNLTPLNNFDLRQTEHNQAISKDSKIISPLNEPINKPQNFKALTGQTINLGIHIEDDVISVGAFCPKILDSGKFHEIIPNFQASMVFLSNRVVIGQGALDYEFQRPSYFTLTSLLSAPQGKPHEIFCRNEKVEVCNEEMLAAFFIEIKRQVQNKISATIPTIVLSISFLTSSDQRERLKAAVSLAGFEHCRIISNFLSSAIAVSLENPAKKLVCLAHYDQSSFSAAITEINSNSVILEAIFGSECIEEKPSQEFLRGQQQLTSGQQLKGGEKLAVEQMYHQILSLCKNHVQNLLVEDMIVTGSKSSESLGDDILQKFWRNKIKKLDPNGPLKGASFLAATMQSKSPLKAHDLSNFRLELHIGDIYHRFEDFQSILSEKKVFSKNFYAKKGGTCTVEFKQEFSKRRSALISNYKLTLKIPPTNKFEYSVTVDCHVDENGVYTLTFRAPSDVTVTPFRIDRYLYFNRDEVNFTKFLDMFNIN